MPSLLGGQVKTFHPQVYAGIMARRQVDADMAGLVEQDIRPIDLVVVNVRPVRAAGRQRTDSRSTKPSR